MRLVKLLYEHPALTVLTGLFTLIQVLQYGFKGLVAIPALVLAYMFIDIFCDTFEDGKE